MKHITKATSTVLLLCTLILLASCGAQGCEHEFGEWEVMKEATCGAGGYSIRVCSLCGTEDRSVKYALPHSFAEEWIYDGSYHWHRATCEHTEETSDKAAHTFGTGNTCTVCGALRATQGLAYRGILGAGEYLVTGIGTTLDENVVVARYFNGHTVVGLADSAFEGAVGLRSVYLQKYIRTVGARAFANCPDLTSVTLTPGVESLGAELFSGSENLTQLIFLGTVSEWQAVEKHPSWLSGTEGLTVRCTDAVITAE